MPRVFPVLADQRSSLPLFKTDYQSFPENFRRASNNIGIEAVPHQMRHPGPSLDLAKGVRDITSCQKRGRWATMTSLERYEKHGRLNDTWRLLSPATQAYCLTFEHDAEGFILAGKTCPLPPRLVEQAQNPLLKFHVSLTSPAAHVCSSIELDIGRFLARPMIGGVLSEIDFGNTTFLGCLCRSRVAKTLQVLSLLKENGLGISPFSITSIVTGDTGSAMDTNIWRLCLFQGSIFRCDPSVLSFLSS